MCEFCEKVEMTKYGLMINLDIAKGIYDNHKTCRYCVCRQNGFIVYIAKDIEEAEDVLEKYKKYFEVKIVDLETYTSTTERRVREC